jgi:hypothetical protein
MVQKTANEARQEFGIQRIFQGNNILEITDLGEAKVIYSSLSGIVLDANPQTFEDTSFVVGDSPVILDVNTALSRNATQITIINDGAGSFTVALSNDGASFGDEHTMNNGEVYSFENLSVDSIRITHVADSAYRVVVI